MSTWPNRGASGGPCGGRKRENPKTQTANLTVRPTRSDSSQQASSKPGAVQKPLLRIQYWMRAQSTVARAKAGTGRRPVRAPMSGRHTPMFASKTVSRQMSSVTLPQPAS
jgi:hypothetical protein